MNELINAIRPVLQYTLSDGKNKEEYVAIEVSVLKGLLAKLNIDYIEFEEDR